MSKLCDTVERLRVQGDSYIYHTGFLMLDRIYNHDVAVVGNEAWQLGQTGMYELVQRKLAVGIYSYIIRRR